MSSPNPKPAFDFAKWWDRVGILLVLLALVVFMVIAAPNFTRVDNILNILRAISINAILAAGMTFVILTAGIDLSVGSIVAVSGVVSVLAAVAGVPAPLAILLGMAAGAACGMVNGMLSAYLALAPFIVTLGTMTFLRGLAYTLTEGKPVVSSTLSFKALGSGYWLGIPIPVYIMAAVYLISWFVLERTTFGRHVYAVGGNPTAARLAGVKVKRVTATVYVIAGVCAGIAGLIFSARVISAQPTAGQGYELDAIAAVVLGGTSLMGGRGRILGTLIGAAILGVLTTGLILLNVPFFTQLLVKGAVIIFAVAIDSLKQRPFLFGSGKRPDGTTPPDNKATS
ncbi:Ribose transport system permease protein RbsC [Nereida ignava]|jgi:ribose transport system permease protein|uniref:Ribose transport system permease protein RbsC n=1 Tax=Nereida ignava TaxID=282199 RepID=A0A0U1NPP5_9RHOB|nr:ABC transporter permease [Nereida ignava]CRK76715.1 Ribose transport system permease protein RbsC [Nereida ignava]SFJ89160.1 ribose transport system permease protein [Nereida ignava DSM 16309]